MRRALVGAALLLALLPSGRALAPASAQDGPGLCTALLRPLARGGGFLTERDLSPPGEPVNGDDLLALVHRGPTGSLPPDYRPDDLVDLATGRPERAHRCRPPAKQCLRAEAAEAYRRMAAAMEEAGHRPHIGSAYRGYRVQCATFLRWARRGSFCDAARASALPGHSQHQLGTAIDLFDQTWSYAGNRFRRGFGCSPGGLWLARHAEEYGFVIAYPLHPHFHQTGEERCTGEEERLDPRTGYRYEPWHLRFIGVEATQRFAAARRAQRRSGVELALDEWLRVEAGDEAGAVTPPVCDGCACGACATFGHEGDREPCDPPALRLANNGEAPPTAAVPHLTGARLARSTEGYANTDFRPLIPVLLQVTVDVPPNTWTAPPVVTPASDAFFRRGDRHIHAPHVWHEHPRPPQAWQLGIGFDDREDYPWRVALVGPERDGGENSLDAAIPAQPGAVTLTVPLHRVHPGTRVRVALVRGDEVRDETRRRAP